MKIAICDDCATDIDKLKDLLLTNEYINKNAEFILFESGIDFSKSIQNTIYDIAFLDIEMPELNGIEVGRILKEVSPQTLIVFVTNYSEYAIDAFDCEAFHYLLKPINEYKANKVINSLIQKYKEMK